MMSLAGGCEGKQPSDGVVRVDGVDPRLEKAAQEARRRWPEFMAEFNRREANVSYAVKIPFKVKGGGSEHMWVQVTAVEGNTIRGVLDSEPTKDVGYKYKDAVSTTLDQVEDWLVGRGEGNLKGLFSVPVLNEIEAERKKK